MNGLTPMRDQIDQARREAEAAQKGRGGPRRGSGRPKIPAEQKLVQITVTIEPATLAAIEARRTRYGLARGGVVDRALRALQEKEWAEEMPADPATDNS